MQLNGLIFKLSKDVKLLIGVFLVVLSIGFYTGLLFVKETSAVNPSGIEQQYLGNEDDENAEVMQFKKSPQEMLTLVHNHILSMSVIFFLVGLLVSITSVSRKMKLFLMIEPLISVILTFGGLFMLWSGVLWFKYIVMISGFLMVLSYTLSVVTIVVQLFKK